MIWKKIKRKKAKKLPGVCGSMSWLGVWGYPGVFDPIISDVSKNEKILNEKFKNQKISYFM